MTPSDSHFEDYVSRNNPVVYNRESHREPKVTSDVFDEITGHNRRLNLRCQGQLRSVRKALHKLVSFRFHQTADIEARLSADKRIDGIRF